MAKNKLRKVVIIGAEKYVQIESWQLLKGEVELRRYEMPERRDYVFTVRYTHVGANEVDTVYHESTRCVVVKKVAEWCHDDVWQIKEAVAACEGIRQDMLDRYVQAHAEFRLPSKAATPGDVQRYLAEHPEC